MSKDNYNFDEIRRKFEQESGLSGIDYEIREREGSNVLLIKVANPRV